MSIPVNFQYSMVISLYFQSIHIFCHCNCGNFSDSMIYVSTKKGHQSFLKSYRLYKSLGDFDVLRGIFGTKVGNQEVTCEALEAEARGDYQAAAKLYTEVCKLTAFMCKT